MRLCVACLLTDPAERSSQERAAAQASAAHHLRDKPLGGESVLAVLAVLQIPSGRLARLARLASPLKVHLQHPDGRRGGQRVRVSA